MIGLILLTHGTLGRSLYYTASLIVGEQEHVHYLSSGDLSPVEIRQRVKSIVENPGLKKDGVLILVDLKGGNTWNVACSLAHEFPWVRVVSGANLGMLLSFFIKRKEHTLDQLMEILVEDGHRGIDKYKPK